MAASDIHAFEALVQASKPRAASLPSSKFVKKIDEIPSVELSSSEPCRIAVQLAENALIGKFTGLWPNPKSVESWMAEHWYPLMQGEISLFAAGRGYFAFLFPSKEAKDRIFRSGPFFMGSRGLFLAPWTLDFNPEAELTAAPIWVRLPHLPLHLWGKSSLEDIGNKLGRFLDSSEPKGGQYTCARICVEVNLEKGLPEAIKLTKGNWSHIQELDYEQIPFKCISCHVYGHFAKNCPKLTESQKASPPAEAGFQTVSNRRRGNPRRKEPTAQTSKGTPTEGASMENHNRFEALQEDEIQVPEARAPEEEPPPKGELPGHPESEIAAAPAASEAVDLAEPGTSPSKQVESSPPAAPTPRKDCSSSAGGSDSESIPRPSPPLTRGRKTNKERREAEAFTSISSGSQTTLSTYLKRKPSG